MAHTIQQALRTAEQVLATASETPKLDAEVLLAHVLAKSRTYLYAHNDQVLSTTELDAFQLFIAKREKGAPIAYLTGHKEFWSLDLLVTPDTLIPRPETETLVERVLNLHQKEFRLVADLGTGTGAIALALAKERPHWQIHATDKSEAALTVAEENAKRLKISNVMFHSGFWCEALPPLLFDVIVSNPPYIAEDDHHLKDKSLRYEPRGALVAGNDGLDDIAHIADEAKHYLKPGGYILIEHGHQQFNNVKRIFEKAGYTDIDVFKDGAGLDRVTQGRLPLEGVFGIDASLG